MDKQEYYAVLNELVSRNEAAWQVTVVQTEGSSPAKPGMKMLIPLSGKAIGNLGGGEMEHHIIAKVCEEQPPRTLLLSFVLSEQGDTASLDIGIPTAMICGGKVTVFIEPLFSSKLLDIVGAGHCGKALARLAGLCGYRTRLIDNRREVLAEISPEICADLHFSDYSNLEAHIRFGLQARIVIMTHGHSHDRHVLEQCLGKPYGYLGMIGSTAKVAATLEKLHQKGFLPDELARVHTPIGLPIGSQTPYEIAVSILAQLIQLDSGKESS
ncbi:MAG: XdhC family protein [Candidatus Syntrophosphaera sp.]|nr:XdhC family protein [Candidatus Syntrophosphaera sp.]